MQCSGIFNEADETELEIPDQELAALLENCDETDQSLDEVVSRAIINLLQRTDDDGER